MAASQGASMSRINALRIAKWLLVGMATLPAALYAYLGHFSRMTGDDFTHIPLGLEHGPWENVLYWRNTWNGATTVIIFFTDCSRLLTYAWCLPSYRLSLSRFGRLD